MACVGDRTRKRDNEVKVCKHTNTQTNTTISRKKRQHSCNEKENTLANSHFFLNEPLKLLVSGIACVLSFNF